MLPDVDAPLGERDRAPDSNGRGQATPANAADGPAPAAGVVPLPEERRGKRPSAAQGDALQYATGVGSSERHMYHVATLRQGAQASATSRASLRLTGSPEK